MIKRRFTKEGWEAIVPALMKDGKQYYYLRVNPVEDGDDIIATEAVYDHYPTQEDAEQLYNKLLAAAIRLKKVEIDEYSRSPAVKTYLLNGVEGWETSEDRNSISKAASDKAAIGRTTYTLYHGGVGFPLTPSEVIATLAKVEVYASDCYDVTEQHKRYVDTLLNIQEVKDYDYTVGYPEKLHLNV